MSGQPDMLAAALAYARRGLPVFPIFEVDEHGICVCKAGTSCKEPGKHPRYEKGSLEHGNLDATTDEATIRRWWKKRGWGNSNIGIPTGERAGAFVLDVDDGPEGVAELSQYPRPATPWARTGGGQHLWFKWPGKRVGNRGKKGKRWRFQHFDLRGDGGYVVVPPSRHHSGARYEWIVDLDSAPLPAPDWLVEAIEESNRRSESEPDDRLAAPPDPDNMEESAEYYLQTALKAVLEQGANRNDTGYAMAWQMNCLGMPKEEAWRYHLRYQQEVEFTREDKPPYDEREARKTHDSAYNRPPGDPAPVGRPHRPELPYELNDLGNAHRLRDKAGEILRGSRELKQWYVWDELRWRPDNIAVERIIHELGPDILRDSRAQRNRLIRRKMEDWSVITGNNSRVFACMERAYAVDPLTVTPRQLDSNPMVIAFRNGYYDLETCRLRDPEPGDLVTKVCACDYDPNARSSTWDWLLERFVPDLRQRDDLQMSVGFCLSGRAKEHVFIVYGETKTGKSTLFRAIASALGDYATHTGLETFASSTYTEGGRPREDLVKLVGRRFVVSSETNQGLSLNPSLIKNVTGNDMLSVRALYGKQFDMLPVFGLWILVNHYPRLPADDDAIWQRVHVFKFDRHIPPEERSELERDRTIDPAVTGAAAMAWAIEGWKMYRRVGRLVLPTTLEETKRYRTEVDPLTEFLAEHCDVGERYSDTFANIKRAFHWWARSGGTRSDYSDQRLGLALRKRGFAMTRDETHDKTRRYSGLQVRQETLSDSIARRHDVAWSN